MTPSSSSSSSSSSNRGLFIYLMIQGGAGGVRKNITIYLKVGGLCVQSVYHSNKRQGDKMNE